MKKILCVILCLCMLFSTEMLTFVAKAIEMLPNVDLSVIGDALEALGLIDEYYGDIVIVYCYDPQNMAVGESGQLPDPTNIVLDNADTTFNESFVTRSLVGYKASYITAVELSADDTEAERQEKYLNFDDDGVGINPENGVIQFGLTNVDPNSQRIYYVYYTAIDVNYTIRYYFQNTTGDGYTEITSLAYADEAKTGTYFSDEELASRIEDNVNLPENFEKGYKLLHAIPDMVAADGSTVFQVYFDREYYSMNFDLQEGFGNEQVYDRYGANVTVGVPTKPGYTFDGWYELTVDTNADGIPDAREPGATLLNGGALPQTIGVQDKYYQASWQEISGAASYVIAYWAKEANGKQYLIATKTVAGATAGDIVNGEDDIHVDDVCGLIEHQHTADCGCYHVHTYSCIAGRGFTSTEVKDNDANVINALENGTPQNGCVYAIQNTTDRYPYAERYWLKLYINGQWYQPSSAISESSMQDYVGDEELGQATYNTFSVKKYYINSNVLNCDHTSCGHTCGLEEHTHDSNCKLKITHLVYEDALTDKNVTVKGDGTTIVNVYYSHKVYTLRFFYARSDMDGKIFEVVGGTTYDFGNDTSISEIDVEDAWNAVPTLLNKTVEWGEVKGKPSLIDDYINDAYLKATYHLQEKVLEANDYKYYYFEFVAPFALDISDIWPVDKFESVEINEAHPEHGGNESDYCEWDKAYFSAWNGQKGVKYSTENTNQTIKGAYQYLDENLVFDSTIPGYGDDTVVSYLCYWVNGADVSWSFPHEFDYNIFTQVSASLQQELNTLAGSATTYELGGKEYQKKNGKWYLLYRDFSVFDNSEKDEIGNQTKISLEGYTCLGVEVDPITDKNADGVDIYHYYFYYDLVTEQTITFKNEGVAIHSITGKPYGSLLKDCLEGFDLNLSNDLATYYPVTLEPNAYTFKGWCTTYPCSDATLVDFDTYTIPEEDVILHAYWVKNTYTVKFFNKLDGDLLYLFGGDGNEAFEITHGTFIGSKTDANGNTVVDPYRENDYFMGWFYMDGMTRSKFDPKRTPIKKDMEVFAMWEGTTPRDYTVKYVYKKDGTEVEIAAPTTGVARENSTKTFIAKAGSQLYPEYQSNYFPNSQSHSIVIGESGNEHKFEYFHVDAELEYVIKYVDAATGLPLPINGTLSDGTSIVNGEARLITKSSYVVHSYYPYIDMSDPDNFKYYTPDSYKKSLVLSVKMDEEGNYVGDADKNVIQFEYTLQEQPTGYFSVNFYGEKLGNTDPNLTTANCDLISNVQGSVPFTYQSGEYIPTKHTVNLIQKVGFAYQKIQSDDSVTKNGDEISFSVDADGVEVNVFFARESYEYSVEIHYIESGVEKVQNISGDFEAQYEAIATYELNAVERNKIPGYRPINTVASVTVTENVATNVIVFNFEPIQYSISYAPVTFMGEIKQTSGTMGGYTSPNAENQLYASGEQSFKGSTAKAYDYFEFEGWYDNEDCIGSPISTNEKFIPAVDALSKTETTYFYAKFVRSTGSLTIKRDFTGIDASQVFVYKISSSTVEGFAPLYVTASNSAQTVRIEGLFAGEYTVEQVSDWSWRYGENKTQAVTLVNDEKAIEFKNAVTNNKWLSSNSQFYKNIFGGAVN